MVRKKCKGTELSVFKGREARLNRAIFQALATKGPQNIYEIQKQTRSTKGLKNTRYPSVNKRVKVLEEMGYIKKASVRKAKSGFETSIYELKVQAYLAMLLDSFNLEDLILQLDEEAATAIHRKLFEAIKQHPQKS